MGLAAFYRFFEPRLARSEPLPFDYSRATSDVAEALRQAGLSPEVHQFPSTLETTDFMQEDARELDDVLSFIMHTEVSALPSELRQEMREYLRLASLPCNGRWFFSIPVGALLLSGPPAL
ncbi:hypothetical protein [Archangium lipolyticum]|uniref:hypothetical protein n=1 Tax=Archangium lipolyticum TaxID=2970465 RepID=UPI00214A60EA|nr:hypothetical protein [Archangium lipolyticum]